VARINDLIRQLEASDPALATEITREMRALSERRVFGLNFERHTPEQVELPGRPVRKGDKVNILPPRGEFPNKESKRIWLVDSIPIGKIKVASLIAHDDPDQTREVPIEDLVVVAEFRDPIFPGLVSTGKVERGGDKPFHTVINGENFQALEALLFTHRGKVDAVYIDPPYNTGARDWKYNNDYVESDDIYRHSKWLAFMERRLKLTGELLNPEKSVLVVTIDEKEFLRLGLLLQQVFPEARVQMVTSVVNPSGSARGDEFSRVEEFIFYVFFGKARALDAAISQTRDEGSGASVRPVRWTPLNRDGSDWQRQARPAMFFPVFVDPMTLRIEEVGSPISKDTDRSTVEGRSGLITVWPMKGDLEARWQTGPDRLRELLKKGAIRVTGVDEEKQTATIRYLTAGPLKKIEAGEIIVRGRNPDGSLDVRHSGEQMVRPRTVWNFKSHSARDFGSSPLTSFIPGRSFPYPKSLYAVEDTLRFVIKDNPNAVVLDFFAGSGTTGHAVMRLNKQDQGRRQCILVSNNEVSPEEQKALIGRGLRPGDPDWETWGICDYVTKPRILAAVSGDTPGGEPIKGEYKFTDEFPMAQGFEENAEFFTLTYEAPMRVQSNREFARIAPFLWLRAGSRGRRIDSLDNGWDVTDAYGVLEDLDRTDEFLEAMNSAPAARIAYLVTDEDRLFEAVTRDLPDGVEPVRLYQSYLSNFEIDAMRRVR